jgi:hypothetical protein
MIVSQLLELLEDCDGDAEVQLATQSHYPLRYHLAGVYVEEIDDPDPDDDEAGRIVWLVEGAQHYEDPYGVPEHAWNDAVRP